LNLETDKMQQVLAKYPYYDIATVPAGTYRGIDQDVQSAGIQDILTVRADADPEEVYQITKAIYDSLETLRQVHPSIANLKFDGYKDSLVPLHPGAKRFYQEKNIPLE
jgi:TRAP transporter TAXI family solute receptor